VTAYQKNQHRPNPRTSVPNRRTAGIAAGIEGFFAFVWFGWGQAAAPPWLAVPLGVGSAAGALVALGGVVVAVRAHGQPTPLADQSVRRRYLIIASVEFGLLGVGAAVLGVSGDVEWIPVWVGLVVGAHFVPLARCLGMPSLVPLGLVILVISVLAFIVGRWSDVAPSTVTGQGIGLALFAGGAITLFAGRRLSARLPCPGPSSAPRSPVS